jgi:HTH-type transcriptional regulator/antitoxin HigA
MRYTNIIERGPKNFSAYAPDFPGCVAAADTEKETVALMKEALAMHIEDIANAANRFRSPAQPVKLKWRRELKNTRQIEKAFAVWPQVEPTLRVPHNDREYRQFVKLLDRLIDQVGEDENHPLASMMEVLGVLIEKYEDENVAELA